MNYFLSFFFFFSFSFFSFAQESTLLIGDTTIYNKVDSIASFKEGRIEMLQYFSSNIKFPEVKDRSKLQGRYYVCFIIEKDGSVSDVKPIGFINHPTELDLIFIKQNKKVLLDMPKWNPSILNGLPVRSVYTYPFHICVGR